MRSSRLHLFGAFAILACSTALATSDASRCDKALDRAMELIDLVLEHHVDPPTRHEMVLSGAKALFRAAQAYPPFSLSERVSRLSSPEQFRAFLEEVCAETSSSIASSNSIEFILLNGIAGAVPGETFLRSADEFKVEQQLAGNRYVGIGIVLRFDSEKDYPRIGDTFARGSAHQGGAKGGDLITAIDGADTHKMPLKKAVEMLRGAEGTSVTITLFSPEENERTITIPRIVVPRQTVRGYKERAQEEWNYRVKDSLPIAYARITEFSSSTVHELRQIERDLRSDGFRALILDLRGASDGRFQETALVADALLDGGVIGQVRTSKGVRKYEADADCLFRKWPMAVLVSEHTSGEYEWLAAALQDNKRAVLVGQSTPARGVTFSSVPTSDGGAVTLATGVLERGDGTTLAKPGSFRPRGPTAQTRDGGVKPDHALPDRQPPNAAQFSPDGGENVEENQSKPRPERLYRKEPGVAPRGGAKEMDAAVRKAIEVLEAALAGQTEDQRASNDNFGE
jgi:carboxyl-terminal processing protease